MAITIDPSWLSDNDNYTTHSSEISVTTSGYVPLTTTNKLTINTSPILNDDCLRYAYDDVIATKTSSDYYAHMYATIKKAVNDGKLKKEKKEMANAKMCDICGAVYSTKKYTKIFNDMEDNYDIHLRFFDSCSNDVEICPDCYKALVDKLVERGLEPVEKDNDKDDD